MTRHSSPRSDRKDLQKFGPRLEIEVRLPIIGNRSGQNLLDSNKQRPEKTSRMPALIDTGAATTVLTPQAVQKVALPLVDYTQVSRAGGIDRVGVHVASIHFPSAPLATIEVIQVLCCSLSEQYIECLIGRDILSRWLFTYDGRSGGWFIDEDPLDAWVEPSEGLWE